MTGEPSREDQIQWNKLCKNARKAAEGGHPREALECYKKASLIHITEKITRRIAKLEVSCDVKYTPEKLFTVMNTQMRLAFTVFGPLLTEPLL